MHISFKYLPELLKGKPTFATMISVVGSITITMMAAEVVNKPTRLADMDVTT